MANRGAVSLICVCFLSFFFYTAAALKVCELCSTGIACHMGVAEPLKGQCASSCDACKAAGYDSCQDCKAECMPLNAPYTCNSAVECCGSMGGQATCEDRRCCTTLNTFCTNSGDCCKNLRCSEVNKTCVSGTSREVVKPPNFVDTEIGDPTIVEEKQAEAQIPDTAEHGNKFIEEERTRTEGLPNKLETDNHLVEEPKLGAGESGDHEFSQRIKSETELPIDSVIPKDRDAELHGKLKTEATKQVDNTMLEMAKDDVNEVDTEKLINAKPRTTKLSNAVETDAPKIVYDVKLMHSEGEKSKGQDTVQKLEDEIEKGEPEVVGNVKAKSTKLADTIKTEAAKIVGNAKILRNDDEESEGENVVHEHEDKKNIKDVLKDSDTILDTVLFEVDEETINAKAEDVFQLDNVSELVDHHVNLRESEDESAKIELCYKKREILLRESNGAKKLLDSVLSVFDDIDEDNNGETRGISIRNVRDFFREIALNPNREEELFRHEDALRQDIEEDNAEDSISLYGICRNVIKHLEIQNKQLTKVFNGVMDIIKAACNKDYMKFKTKSTALSEYVSGILRKASGPGDGSALSIDWNDLLSSLPIDLFQDNENDASYEENGNMSEENGDDSGQNEDSREESENSNGENEDTSGVNEESSGENDKKRSGFVLPTLGDLHAYLHSLDNSLPDIGLRPLKDAGNPTTDTPVVTDDEIINPFQSTEAPLEFEGNSIKQHFESRRRKAPSAATAAPEEHSRVPGIREKMTVLNERLRDMKKNQESH